MSVIEIEQQIKPLSRADKLQLIKDIQDMLREESPELSDMFEPGKVYDIVSPDITPDASTTAAQQLQRAIEEQSV